MAFEKLDKNIENTENLWTEDLVLELDRQRPKGEDKESEQNIDWWHFTAYAEDLAVIDKQKLDSLISKSDIESVVRDFNILRKQDHEDVNWAAPVYAARLQRLGWQEETFGDDEWGNFGAELEDRRKKEEWWFFAFYIDHLLTLDHSKARSFITEDDMAQMRKAADQIRGKAELEDSPLLTLTLENNLQKIDPLQTQSPFINQDILSAKERLRQLQNTGDWHRAAQYLSAIKMAQLKD